MGRWILPPIAVLLTCLVAFAAHAHEGHDHGAPPPLAIATAPRAAAQSALFELVAVAEAGGLTIYLDRFDTNAPISDAEIAVETPTGPATASPTGDTYRLDAPWVSSPGPHDLIFTVTAGADIDFLTATLDVPAPPLAPPAPVQPVAAALWSQAATGDARVAWVLGLILGLVIMFVATRRRPLATLGIAAAGATLAGALIAALVLMFGALPAAAQTVRDTAQRLPDGSVFVPKLAQRLLEIRTQQTVAADHARAVELPGRVIVDPNASGYVQTAVGGRLMPPPGGFPVLGTRVRPGEVLAYVTPALAAIDQSDIVQAQAALDQDIMVAEVEVARIKRLVDQGLFAPVLLRQQEVTLQGLRDRRAAFATGQTPAEALVAPVAGVIAAANASPGRIAESNAVIFHIVDPTRLWVEALSQSPHAIAAQAWAGDGAGGTVALGFIGAGFAEGAQAQTLHFRAEVPGALRPGQLVTVTATTATVASGLAIPRDAVIRAANGQDVVYEHTGPEIFAPRAVRLAMLDGARVLIEAGVAPGARVVTQGAELLNQLR